MENGTPKFEAFLAQPTGRTTEVPAEASTGYLYAVAPRVQFRHWALADRGSRARLLPKILVFHDFHRPLIALGVTVFVLTMLNLLLGQVVTL